MNKQAWVGICVGGCAGFLGVANFEGESLSVYYDIGGIPTACYGETANIKPGDKFTHEQCRAMLGARVETYFGPAVDRCTKVPLPPKRKAAMVDFAYNLGVGKYCTKIAPILNSGNTKAACDKLLDYVKGGGLELPGLVKRRHEERALCLEELA